MEAKHQYKLTATHEIQYQNLNEYEAIRDTILSAGDYNYYRFYVNEED